MEWHLCIAMIRQAVRKLEHRACLGSLSKLLKKKGVPAMSVSQAVKQAVNGVLSTELPIVSKWHAVVQELLKHGLAWKAVLTANMLLVHKQNRSGMNGHQVHNKGQALLKSGFDMRFLHSSTCTLDKFWCTSNCLSQVDSHVEGGNRADRREHCRGRLLRATKLMPAASC